MLNNPHDDLHNGLHDKLEDTVLRLSDYLQTVEMVVKQTFAHQVWVKAEIRNLSIKGGHYYFELAEKNDTGKIIASCRANLWKFQASRLLKKFAQTTGMQLSRDLTVMLKVTANMHPQYGFSLTISDIDPTYTMGDLARQYTAMLDRLTGEGLTQLNKSLETPLDLQHIIVISPENAAGLGDFRAEADHLQANGACHFHYHHATFQGNHAPKEIRHAMVESLKQFHKKYRQLPDIMVIIRGGGAVGDLAYLNDYELGALVAEQPIPVWVGIGHERDRVILDEVAHRSFDTPSKVINAIINHLRGLVDDIYHYSSQIEKLSYQQLRLAQADSQRCFNQLQLTSISCLSQWQSSTENAITRIQQNAERQLLEAKRSSDMYLQQTQSDSQKLVTKMQRSVQAQAETFYRMTTRQLSTAKQQTHFYYQQHKQLSQQQLTQAKKDTDYFRNVILVQRPQKILEKGYAIVRNEKDELINSCHQLSHEQSIQIQLRDGSVWGRVDKL